VRHANGRVFRAWFLCLVAAAVAPIVPLTLGASSYFFQSEKTQPPVRIPSNVAWTDATVALASDGDALRGLLIARRCDHCHGTEGFSSTPTIPNLAAMDRLSTWKQLQDFRAGKRNSPLMQMIAGVLSIKEEADLAAYYSMVPNAADPQDNRIFPQRSPDSASANAAAQLVTLGDGSRGIPPCQACHGPSGYVRGAPTLATQNSAYILSQLEAFASGTRANDINMRMRTIASQLTDAERHAVSDYYGAGLGILPPGAATHK
jgi:cytochrome c553